MAEQVVREGQVWADNDRRSRGRTLKVVRVENGRALCVVLTDGPHPIRSAVGRTVAIKLDRFKPTSTGYRLVGPTAEAGESRG